MDDSYKRMKVDVMTMAAEDAVQLALERYDESPSSKSPIKLISGRTVDLSPVVPEDVSKKFKSRKGSFIDLSLSELLSLGMLAQLYRHKDGHEYDVILSVEDSWNPHAETVISDGAFKKHGDYPRMLVQQVMAQDISKTKAQKSIEQEVVDRISEKNQKMISGNYPEDTALLVSVFTTNQRLFINEIIKHAPLNVFKAYFLVYYSIPDLNFAYVVTLGGDKIPPQYRGDTELFELTRHENPYGYPSPKD